MICHFTPKSARHDPSHSPVTVRACLFTGYSADACSVPACPLPKREQRAQYTKRARATRQDSATTIGGDVTLQRMSFKSASKKADEERRMSSP
ncbi:hypothetical protein ACOMHN_063133 [Nucella lapillus]